MTLGEGEGVEEGKFVHFICIIYSNEQNSRKETEGTIPFRVPFEWQLKEE